MGNWLSLKQAQALLNAPDIEMAGGASLICTGSTGASEPCRSRSGSASLSDGHIFRWRLSHNKPDE
jgi:hypothetical protein